MRGRLKVRKGSMCKTGKENKWVEIGREERKKEGSEMRGMKKRTWDVREVKKSDRKIVDQEKEVIYESKMIKVRKWDVWKGKGKKGGMRGRTGKKRQRKKVMCEKDR